MIPKRKRYNIFQFGIDDMPDWFYNADPNIIVHFKTGSIIKSSTADSDMWYEILQGEYVFRNVETGRIFVLPNNAYENLLAEDLIWRWRDEAYATEQVYDQIVGER